MSDRGEIAMDVQKFALVVLKNIKRVIIGSVVIVRVEVRLQSLAVLMS